MVTKHRKPSAANQQGGIVNKEAPFIHASNVMLVVNGVATRVGFKDRWAKKSALPKKVRFDNYISKRGGET